MRFDCSYHWRDNGGYRRNHSGVLASTSLLQGRGSFEGGGQPATAVERSNPHFFELFGTVDHGTHLSTSLEVMDSDLVKHIGVDPHVETSREELEFALRDMQVPAHKVDQPTFMGTGNPQMWSVDLNRSIHASSTSDTNAQQPEVVLAADGPGSHPHKMPWPQISIYNASQ